MAAQGTVLGECSGLTCTDLDMSIRSAMVAWLKQTTLRKTRGGSLSHHRVDFSPTVQYGHTLIEASPERQHRDQRPPIHLPNTLRNQEKGQPPTEKMVDTALAADLLAWARRSPSEWALVLAEDDDVAPPLFTAEAWIKPHDGRVLLLRKRPAGQYLRLDGLLRKLP